jgi:hypothetical protein
LSLTACITFSLDRMVKNNPAKIASIEAAAINHRFCKELASQA